MTTDLLIQSFAASIPSPIGPLDVTVDGDGRLLRIDMPGDDPSGRAAEESFEVERGPLGAARCAHVLRQLEQYFAGERREFDLALAPTGTDFQQQAWNVLRTIGYGETISYAEQARRLGRANAARAVGAANGRNPIPIVVPCHRVVGADGKLVGFAGGVPAKRWLLDHERRTVNGDESARP